MNQVVFGSKARRYRHVRAAQGRALLAGVAALLATMGAAGCAVEPTTGEDEPIDSVSQPERDWGWNGVPPAVIAGNYLSRPNTDAAHITTPDDPNLSKLCGFFDGQTCELSDEWLNWINPNGADPPDPDTVNRTILAATLFQCAMTRDVKTHLPGGVPGYEDVAGMFRLSPQWTDQSMEVDSQESVSTCVASKVNAFLATVPIGIVGPGPAITAPDPIDDQRFYYQEAAFYGTLTGNNPHMYACTGKKAIDGSQAVGQDKRICAQPNNPCFITSLGPCKLLCDPAWGNPGIPTGEYCSAAKAPGGVVYTHPLTVYLETMPKK